MLDETGREMHKLVGKRDRGARTRSRAWARTSCAGSSAPSRRTGTCSSATGPANEIKRKLLTLWNSVGFFVTYANIEGFRPEWKAPAGDAPLDRWLVARTAQFVDEAEAGYEAYLTVDVIRAFESFVDDLSNWYIRRSRRRFYSFDEARVLDAVARARAVAPRHRAR